MAIMLTKKKITKLFKRSGSGGNVVTNADTSNSSSITSSSSVHSMPSLISSSTKQPARISRRLSSPPSISLSKKVQQVQPHAQKSKGVKGEDETDSNSRAKSFSCDFIFDGTQDLSSSGASSQFAAFIHDGDSEDEMNDNDETERWKTIQDHV